MLCRPDWASRAGCSKGTGFRVPRCLSGSHTGRFAHRHRNVSGDDGHRTVQICHQFSPKKPGDSLEERAGTQKAVLQAVPQKWGGRDGSAKREIGFVFPSSSFQGQVSIQLRPSFGPPRSIRKRPQPGACAKDKEKKKTGVFHGFQTGPNCPGRFNLCEATSSSGMPHLREGLQD